jgi:hypothetical protein
MLRRCRVPNFRTAVVSFCEWPSGAAVLDPAFFPASMCFAVVSRSLPSKFVLVFVASFFLSKLKLQLPGFCRLFSIIGDGDLQF